MTLLGEPVVHGWLLALALVGGCHDAVHRPPPASRGSAAEASVGATPADVAEVAERAGDGGDASDAALPDAAPPAARPLANVDPKDDMVVGPPDVIPDCEEQLAREGVTFRPASLGVHLEGKAKLTCGAPQVVTYLRGPGKIDYRPTPLVTCGMALAMGRFEAILQAEAERTLGARITRIDQLGTYNCRPIARFPGVVSEHSYANAIDYARFVLANGKSVTVLHDFDQTDAEPRAPAGRFLRSVSVRGYDEQVFSNVLTPFWDAGHANHFHLDLGRYRVDGVHPQTASH